MRSEGREIKQLLFTLRKNREIREVEKKVTERQGKTEAEESYRLRKRSSLLRFRRRTTMQTVPVRMRTAGKPSPISKTRVTSIENCSSRGCPYPASIVLKFKDNVS